MFKHLVMIVDDSTDYRLIMRRLLQRAGLRSLEARSAREALTFLAQGYRPSLIITEHMISEFSGSDFVAVVRHNIGLTYVPVLLTTSHPCGYEIARQARFDGYLDKRDLFPLLIKQVHHLLQRT